jgi:hypothetical protein
MNGFPRPACGEADTAARSEIVSPRIDCYDYMNHIN